MIVYTIFDSVVLLQVSDVDLTNYEQDKWQVISATNYKYVWGEYEKANQWFYTAIKQRLTLKRISGIDRKLAVFPLLGKIYIYSEILLNI
jgi:hypothetical protein